MAGQHNPVAGSPLSAECVRAQLGRILRSPNFSHAPTLSRLLRYLVEHAIQGDPSQLKEYVVGVEVLGRRASFDPRTDTIVRVHARRLRSKLEEYYKDEGHADPIVIEVPVGGYRAVFRTASPRHPASLQVFETERLASSRPPPLPAPRTRLIGRERELARVKKLLRNENVRLVTLTGAGGSGKTRLALQAAAGLSDEFPGGVYFAALASINNRGGVLSAIAQLLGVRHTGGKPLVEALREHLRLSVSSPILLLLDNFEHLLDQAPLLADLLEACLTLKIFVTSRAVLHVYGEHEYPVPPLAVPDLKRLPPFEELARYSAVALFVERAAAADPGFTLNAGNGQAVAEICARIDGLPLAIELAAARVKMLAPAALLSRLQSRLEILTGGPVDLPARQQTLRRTIGWSHELLSPAEQKLFRRLSVFSGGCTLESAEAVADTRRDLGIDVLAGVASLVDISLLQRVRLDDGADRFLMLETIREYGLERLAVSGETEAVMLAHAAYCLVVAEEGNAQLSVGERAQWLALCDAEHENLRAAVDWLIKTGNAAWAMRLGQALCRFWERREQLAEGRERLEAILNMKGASARTGERARLLASAGILSAAQGDLGKGLRLHRDSLEIYRELGDKKGLTAQCNALGTIEGLQGDYSAARSWLNESLSLCRQLGDRTEIAAALSNLADVVNAQGEHSTAHSLLEEALSIFRELGDYTGVAWSLNHSGDAARDGGDLAAARRFYQDGADIFRQLGERWGMGRSSFDLGYLACDQSDYAAAHCLFGEALDIFLKLGHKRGVVKVLEGFAYSAALRNDRRRALTLAGAAAALRHSMGIPSRPAEKAMLEGALQPAWQQENPATAKIAWDTGWKMLPDQAIQFALGGPPRTRAVSTHSSPDR
jgi:predicted ATPase